MRRIITINIALCFYLLLAPLQVQAQFNGGDGTSGNPYQVATATQLNSVRNHLSAHFIQTANIDLDIAPYNTGTGWVPIGDYLNAFTGSYNGDGHTISGLFINLSEYNSNSVGLFGHTESSASLTKVGLLNANVKGNNHNGILVGENRGTISECYATGNVTGMEDNWGSIGGLVGNNYGGTVTDSYANSEVSGGMEAEAAGGLVGSNVNSGTVTNSYATGNVNGESSVGGLVGNNFGTVTKSFATGKVNGGYSVGGLVGYNTQTVTNSYATGTATGNHHIGGLVGYNVQTVTSSYATGEVSGSGSVGGLVGINQNESGKISDSYATGKVSGTSDVGGLVGRNISGATITTSYWNTETSERSSSQGGTGLTTAQMRAQSSFTGWDFSTVWAIKSDSKLSYPYLRTNEQSPPPGEYILPFAGGDGTSGNPYQVATATHLNNVRNHLNAHFIQTANIDLNVSPYNTGTGWVPIGDYLNAFTGSYNGDGHTISGLFINLSGYNNVGLFGNTSPTASLTKVGLLNANVKGNNHTGILVGENRGTISECYATGNVTGMEFMMGSIGGLVGSNENSGSVTNSYATGNVNGKSSVGGLAGYNGGTVNNSYATGEVSGSESVGGLAGYNGGTVTQSFATGKVNGEGSVGGLVGDNSGTVTNSYATGTATGTHHIGGLVGYNFSGTVNNSYATGEVSGSESVGGLVGINQYESGKISESYATGKVSGTSDVGGLVGRNISGATATNSYWNTETSEKSSSQGGTGLTTAQMRAQSSFTGWDFSTVWAIKSDSKLSYPYLRTNVQTPPPGEKINPFAGGDGSEANPFQITTATQLNSVRDHLGSHFIQTANIDLNVSPYNTDAGWVPIGVYLNEFTGSYNGDGHTISGLFVDLSGNNAVGLFGYTGSSALITNVGVVDVDIKGNSGVGGLVGINYYGTVTNSFATGKVDGVDDVGGLIGGNAGTVSNTYATGMVTGSKRIGGLVGANQYGQILDSYAMGHVSGTSHVGGLIGQNIDGATATNSYWNTETSETAISDGGTGLTTAQMVDAANFTGWDFANTWLIDSGFTFPMLKNANQHITSVLTIKGKEGWRMLSSPLKNTAYGALLNPLWLQGFTGADVTHGMPNVLTWNETAKAFIPITNSTDFAGEGTGFITYVFSDDDKDGTAEGFPKRLLNSGAQHIGPVSPSITFTESDSLKNDGWNLLGNPYGTTIDWDAANGWNRTNLDATYYVWSDTASDGKGAYLSWTGLGVGTLPNSLIAPGQGFWVKASSASPSISLNDTVRSSNGTFFKRAPVPQLKFNLQNNEISSNTIVMFSEKAERGKDPYDAYKMNSLNTTYLSLFTELEDGSRLDINALPIEFEHPLAVEMGFEGSDIAGTGTLSWEVLSLPSGWSVHLTDRVSGASVNLKDATAYTFTVDAKTKSSAKVGGEITAPTHPMMAPSVKKKGVNVENRFVLLVSSKTSVAVEPAESLPTHIVLHQNYPNPFNPSTSITFGLPESGKVRLEVFDMVGRKVATLLNGESKTAGRHTVNFNAKNLSSGMYIYRLQAGSTILTKKLTLIK